MAITTPYFKKCKILCVEARKPSQEKLIYWKTGYNKVITGKNELAPSDHLKPRTDGEDIQMEELGVFPWEASMSAFDGEREHSCKGTMHKFKRRIYLPLLSLLITYL